MLMGMKRGDLLSEIKNGKDALIASEKRGRKAVRRLRDFEKVFETLLPKMKNWAELPVSDDAPARCMTTGEVRALVRLLEDKKPDPATEEAEAST